MKKIELEVVALSHSLTHNQSYAVVLNEINGYRRLPVIIGYFEAQAIAVALEKVSPSRPLTHDLVKNLFNELNIDLKEVIINNLQEGIFYAQLICAQEGKIVELDSRTSDALALSIRFGCPIYTYEFILESAGIVLEEKKKEKTLLKNQNNPLSNQSIEQLEKHLNDALTKEDYERAAHIRDEIKRRESE